MIAPPIADVEAHHDRLRAILVVADRLDEARADGLPERAAVAVGMLIELHCEAIAELLRVPV